MVKPASGVVMPAPTVQGGGRVSRRVQVHSALIDAIRCGALPPGTRLPSSRQLAAEWGFARGPIDEALALLQQEGVIERRVGDGSYIAEGAASMARAARAVPPVVRPLSRSAQQVLERFSAYLGKPEKSEVPRVLLASQPLFPRAPNHADFPLETWRRLITRAHGEAFRDHLSYGPAAGLPHLREAIARHVSLARGMRVNAEQVVVVNSPTHGIELIARVLLEPGDAVWLEDPGHSGMVHLFQVLRNRITGVPLDEHGLDVAAGRARAPNAAAVYFHPLTQFPLGVRTSTARLRELLQWADQSGAWIIEGNFNDEILHSNRLPASLQSMDAADRVLMMGTFEGIMFPALRLAYLVVPERLAHVFVAMRGMLGDHSNVALQLALASFMDEGHLNVHLRKLRQVVGGRREALLHAAARHLPAWARLGPLDGGMHAAIHLPPDVPDREAVRQLRAQGVIAVAISSTCIEAQHGNGLVVGYGAFEPAVIERSIALVGSVLRGPAAAGRPAAHQAAGENR